MVLRTLPNWGRAGAVISHKAKKDSYEMRGECSHCASLRFSVREKSVWLIADAGNTGDPCLLTRSQPGTVDRQVS